VVDAELASLSAREQLRLMVGWSDNASAAVIAQAIGFRYLWALARFSGLFRTKWPKLEPLDDAAPGSGGLLLLRDYNHGFWLPKDAPTDGLQQAATARSLATLLTLLGQDRLLDPAAHVMMREMLRRAGLKKSESTRGEWSPIGQGLADAGWTATQPAWNYDPVRPPAQFPPAASELAVAKVGFLDDDSQMSDALLVRSVRPLEGGGTKPITAVLVAMYSRSRHKGTAPDSVSLVTEFGKKMADVLNERHKLA
jgi:hypothetical protein